MESLKKKHGSAIRGKIEETDYIFDDVPSSSYTYFFENEETRGYVFIVSPKDLREMSLSDGTPLVNNKIPFLTFDCQAKDLFLGFDKAITIEEFSKMYDVEIHTRSEDIGVADFLTVSYNYENSKYAIAVYIRLEKDKMIGSNSQIFLNNSSNGV